MPFWAPCVFGILLGPSEAFLLGREAARVFLRFLSLVFVFHLLFCCAATHFLEARVGDLAEVG